jgi:hypothetical protein
MYDGEKHVCSRFQEHTRERQEEIDKEEHDKAFEDYWKNFSLGPIVINTEQQIRNNDWGNTNDPEEDLELAVNHFLHGTPSLDKYINDALESYIGLPVVPEETLDNAPWLHAVTQKQLEETVRLAYGIYVSFCGKVTEAGSFSLFIGNEEIKIDLNEGDDEEIINQKLCQKLRYCD